MAVLLDASASVSSVKKQTKLTSFFSFCTIAVVLELQPSFVHVPFACRWLRGVQILSKRPLSLNAH